MIDLQPPREHPARHCTGTTKIRIGPQRCEPRSQITKRRGAGDSGRSRVRHSARPATVSRRVRQSPPPPAPDIRIRPVSGTAGPALGTSRVGARGGARTPAGRQGRRCRLVGGGTGGPVYGRQHGRHRPIPDTAHSYPQRAGTAAVSAQGPSCGPAGRRAPSASPSPGIPVPVREHGVRSAAFRAGLATPLPPAPIRGHSR